MNPATLDIGSVRSTIADTRKALDKELKEARTQAASLEQTIARLEADHKQLVELERVVGPGTATSKSSPTPRKATGAKRGRKPGRKAAAPAAKKSSTKASAPKRAAGNKQMPEEERIIQVLQYINEQDGKATRGGIVESLSLSAPRVQQLISKMSNDKLIVSKPNPENRVQKLISVTAKGKKAL